MDPTKIDAFVDLVFEVANPFLPLPLRLMSGLLAKMIKMTLHSALPVTRAIGGFDISKFISKEQLVNVLKFAFDAVGNMFEGQPQIQKLVNSFADLIVNYLSDLIWNQLVAKDMVDTSGGAIVVVRDIDSTAIDNAVASLTASYNESVAAMAA